MSYCVRCGVKLNSGAKKCPLCGTRVWEPEENPDEPSYFATKSPEVEPESKFAAGLLLTAMFGSAMLCCAVLNLVLWRTHPWALYVIGAGAMLWIILALPMLTQKIPAFLRLLLDVCSAALYIYLISLDIGGARWFFSLALPLLAVICVVVFVLGFLLRGHRRSILTSAALTIGAGGITALGVEFLTDRFLYGAYAPGWSLVVLIVCVGMVIPLIIIRRVPALREEVRRRFSL
ncbi:MAG: DUF6320 domain-containing protein [Oscillospiraceae bacterium]|nr:DUF6320 domain-containing protein [Oscillospiraceae bacterium]